MYSEKRKLFRLVYKEQKHSRRIIGNISYSLYRRRSYNKPLKNTAVRKQPYFSYTNQADARLFIKAVGVLALPSPAVLAHFVYSSFGNPVKLVFSLCSISITLRYITRTSWVDLIRKLLAASLFKCVQYVKHRITVSRSEIIDMNSGAICFLFYCLNVSYRKVNYMNIISYTRSVRCVVVISVYMNLFKSAYRNLCNLGKKIVGYSLRIFAHISALIRTDRIKVS